MQAMTDKRHYITGCKRLPFSVDGARLQAEVRSLPPTAWGNQRAPVHQETVSVFLRGQAPMLGVAEDLDQPLLQPCTYIKELLQEVLPGRCGKCLLASLQPGGTVYAHMDSANEYFLESFRVHVPVFTNEQVHFFSGRRIFHMAAGEVWSVNNLAPHAGLNLHPREARVHRSTLPTPVPARDSIRSGAEAAARRPSLQSGSSWRWHARMGIGTLNDGRSSTGLAPRGVR